MYLQNKYTNWYFSIISNATSRSVSEGYCEIHHILPKSLNGSNDPENLVKLTAREHFICHLLLPKMVEGISRQKMIYALWGMANQRRPDQHRYKINSKLYGILKLQAAANHKLFKHTNESKKKIGIAHTGKVVSEKSKRLISDIALARHSDHYIKSVETRKLNGSYTIEKGSRPNISKALKGKTRILTDEHKANIALAAKNRVKK